MKRFLALLLCLCLCVGLIPISASAVRNLEFEQSLAQDLKALGLFKGVSETDFALGRAPTRVEALVMLIRVLGQESAATTGSWYHPFTDVPDWADSYVGYAYTNSLTKGVSETSFGTGSATAQMYLTFILRALGYSDALGDFTWDDPYTLARSLDLLPSCVSLGSFWRADVVTVSYAALPVQLNHSSMTLAQQLVGAGAFTQAQFDSVYRPTAISEYTAVRILTAEEIYARCSPAVFYVEVSDASGEPFASGSGFFLQSNGLAVTNYHVIEDACSAKITTSDGKIYDISGVWDSSKTEDWAIIQVEGTGFATLTPATDAVLGGAKVYAIGSPMGLQNTISEGLVSNASRQFGDASYIQTSAAISSGSSGGALIDQYGHVVGITSATFSEGQNLNLAVPISKVQNKSLTTVTPLSILFGGTATTSPTTGGSSTQSTAFDLLKNWIASNSNSVFLKKYPAVALRDTDSSEIVLYYDSESKTIAINHVFVYSDGAKTSLWLDLASSGTSHFVSYYFYNSVRNSKWSVEGAGIIDAPKFSKDIPLTFSSYEGSASAKTDHAELASSLVDLILQDLTDIFQSSPSYFGSCSVASFGFPAM